MIALRGDTIIGMRSLATLEQIAVTGPNVRIRGSEANYVLSLACVTLTGILEIGGAGGPDTLTSTGQADVIHGDAGDDALTGGAGSDAYLFAAGFGNDTIPWTTTSGRRQPGRAAGPARRLGAWRHRGHLQPAGDHRRVAAKGDAHHDPAERPRSRSGRGHTIRLAGVSLATITSADFRLAP